MKIQMVHIGTMPPKLGFLITKYILFCTLLAFHLLSCKNVGLESFYCPYAKYAAIVYPDKYIWQDCWHMQGNLMGRIYYNTNHCSKDDSCACKIHWSPRFSVFILLLNVTKIDEQIKGYLFFLKAKMFYLKSRLFAAYVFVYVMFHGH